MVIGNLLLADEKARWELGEDTDKPGTNVRSKRLARLVLGSTWQAWLADETLTRREVDNRGSLPEAKCPVCTDHAPERRLLGFGERR